MADLYTESPILACFVRMYNLKNCVLSDVLHFVEISSPYDMKTLTLES